jgi:cysteine desulfurase
MSEGVQLPSFIIGGGQEQGRRAGTSAVPNIVGLGAACKLARRNDDHSRIVAMRNQLENEILRTIPNARLNGAPETFKPLTKHSKHLV